MKNKLKSQNQYIDTTLEKIYIKSLNPKKILSWSAGFWFITATLGQWMFAFYVMAFYGRATATGNIEKWNVVLPKGYVSGDFFGNLVVGIHLLLAAIIIICGPLQIISQTKKYMPTFHRWSGRLYIFTAVITSLSGLIMVWTRGSVGGLAQHISISVNAILILVSVFFTVRYALNDDLKRHRMWALRLFLVVNGVWFFRVGLMFWLLINGRPVGFNPDTFEGPFLIFLSISQYTIPLILLELYQRAKMGKSGSLNLAVSALLALFTLVMAIGIFGATVGIWLPRINAH